MTTEHLWQLRYRGKVKGYLRWRPGCWQGSRDGEHWLYVELCGNRVIDIEGPGATMILFDAMHRFVCKDRHGRDVFDGDRVRKNRHICTVEWDTLQLRWLLCEIKSSMTIGSEPYHRSLGFLAKEIELAEEGPK